MIAQPSFDGIDFPTKQKSNEWFTPSRYINAARAVMGGIDLDPASCAAANQIVKAERYFTKEQNGLLQEWKAKSIWLNPPYARTEHYQSGIKLFVDKCLDAYQRGDVLQAIILVTAEINAKWFQPLWPFFICVPDHRVKFIAPQKDKRGVYQHMFGTCFVYLGPNEQKFIEVFSQFGHIVKTVTSPKVAPVALDLWTEVAHVA
jgi:ParB family chromosome partitioning protein